MLRPFAIATAVALATFAGSAAATHTPASPDARIAAAQARESALTNEIDALTAQIRALERRIGDVSTRLATLEADLALYRRRLQRVGALLALQTQQLRILKAQYGVATTRLGARVVQLYVGGGDPSALEVVLGAKDLSEAIQRLDFFEAVARQDAEIVEQVRNGRVRVRKARIETISLKRSVAASSRVVAFRAQQVREVRNGLLSRSRRLASSRVGAQRALAATREQVRNWRAEAAAVQSASANVSATIASEGAATGAPPSSAGLIWPISGTITSPFGMRWGSLHPGLDIAAPMGTPIRAAAAGRVLVAAYSGGYGYLVVIDHGNGMATAYAHQSRLASTAGQTVAQGQVIGYVGSTGFSTGPHVHFEVRVGGSPTDPLGYLS